VYSTTNIIVKISAAAAIRKIVTLWYSTREIRILASQIELRPSAYTKKKPN